MMQAEIALQHPASVLPGLHRWPAQPIELLLRDRGSILVTHLLFNVADIPGPCGRSRAGGGCEGGFRLVGRLGKKAGAPNARSSCAT